MVHRNGESGQAEALGNVARRGELLGDDVLIFSAELAEHKVGLCATGKVVADAELEAGIALTDELGDVLLHVVFHADIEDDAGHFTIDDVCDGVVKKMVMLSLLVPATISIPAIPQIAPEMMSVRRVTFFTSMPAYFAVFSDSPTTLIS